MNSKGRQIIVMVLGLLSLLLITVGVTYAVFTYTKLGSTENTVTAGTLKFLYTENSGVGAGIKLTNALPVSDTVGKSYSTEGQVFDFKLESTNTSNEEIPYEITLRKKSGSTLGESTVKVYLTDMTEGADTEILTPTLYSELENASVDVGEEVEKAIYNGVVLGQTVDYTKNFRLRMWIDEDVDMTDEVNMEKTFTATVNVYANVNSTLKAKILSDNPLIDKEPTLTTSSIASGDASGLYKSTETNSGDPTYYFRGAVTNNYVKFAGQTWRIIRINEDGTVRLIMQDGINNDQYYTWNSAVDMYYTSSNVKEPLETWYIDNLSNYSEKIVTGDYFCEQAKVKFGSGSSSGSAAMTVYTSYTPDFKCETDGNGYGVVNASIGLITYDEMVYAGGYELVENTSYYLYNGKSNIYKTMSPAGIRVIANVVYSDNWIMYYNGTIHGATNIDKGGLRPVINLKANVTVTGSGLVDDPYIIQ